jgi:ketosteroid isomerase-like protein
MSGQASAGRLFSDWAAAEGSNAPDRLAAVLADDFMGVGPVGFVLTKAQWLQRYANGLHNESFALEDLDVRESGDLAIGIGVQDQAGTVQDRRIDGRFRATLVAQRLGDDWRLMGLHLSPIRAPG